MTTMPLNTKCIATPVRKSAPSAVSYTHLEQLQLAGYEISDLTVLRIEQGTRFVPDYEVVALKW